MSFYESYGAAMPVAVFIGIILFLILCKVLAHIARRGRLIRKYGDISIVKMIMDGTVWQGASAEQVLDALGQPEDIDQKILKTKKKEIWKYRQYGQNRYKNKFILENDLVIGWELR